MCMGDFMDRWEVFLTIGTLVTFLLAIGGPMLKLNTTLTKLIDKADSLEKTFEKTQTSNHNVHERMWNELEDHENKLNDHETRLQLMEKK